MAKKDKGHKKAQEPSPAVGGRGKERTEAPVQQQAVVPVK